ncbi:hypothetical protein [Humidesulfovibrio idahonensis]
MDFSNLYARRKYAGLCGSVLLCLVLAFTVDGMIAGGRKDPNAFNLMPGQSLSLSDVMPRGAETLDGLSLRANDPNISLRLTETFSGFWLGGTLWRAQMELPAGMPLGDYTVDMYYQNGTLAAPRQKFDIHVLPDRAAIQAASLSVVMRALGISPYLLAALLLPLAVVPMAASFLLSRKITQALCQHGMSEIFRAMASPDGQRIFFSLSDENALEPETEIQILDERGQKPVGKAIIVAVGKGDAEAVMQDEVQIRPGALAKFR